MCFAKFDLVVEFIGNITDSKNWDTCNTNYFFVILNIGTAKKLINICCPKTYSFYGSFKITLSKLSPEEGWLVGIMKELGVRILLLWLVFSLAPCMAWTLSDSCCSWDPTVSKPWMSDRSSGWNCSPRDCCERLGCLFAEALSWANICGGTFSVLPWSPSSNSCLADLK